TASGDLVEISPFILARDLNAAERKITRREPEPGSAPPEGGLRHLVEAITAAARRSDTAVEPILCAELPSELDYDRIAPDNENAGDQGAAFAISDLPEDRAQRVRRWTPGADGNVLVVGGSPAERWTALTTLFVAVTDAMPPAQLHGYMIDCAANRADETSVLESLAACGAVATADDPDRIVRVLARLTAELDARSSGGATAASPKVVLFVNEVTAFLRMLELAGELEQGRDMLERIVGKGPLHGISTVMSTAGEQGVPARLLGQFQQRVLLHLGDRSAYRALDIDSARIPTEVAARAITVPDLVEIQIAAIGDLFATVAARRDRDTDVDGPDTVPRTPPVVHTEELRKMTEFSDGRWHIPVGLDTRSLEPTMLRLTAPAGGLILGDSGTGKSTVLMNIARCVSNIDSGVDVHAIAATWSPLALLPHLSSATTLAGIDKWAAEFFDRTDRHRLVLVDDADRLDGPVFERLAALDDPRLVVIAAGRTRVLELPAHWTAPFRRSRAAVLLRPLAGDAAMFGLYLRTTSTLPGVGRGFVVDDDTITPVLLAAPGDDHEVDGR
ncbi:MAG TPA: FtsK/SpoIIIE domain-containing protein, partial [Ilumatobacteraceae bacterium]|nr:FtsK/SpoIIIE domain-containing protein [Ilumatobacteraceae bacterium]